MIVHYRGIQDCGKTATAVATVRRLIKRNGYDPGEVIANIHLKIPGTHSTNNDLMRRFVLDMVSKGLKHKVVLIDEADRVFPARFWQNNEQTTALIGLWQDVKMFNWILWTAHRGTGVDLLLRQTTQVGVRPRYYKNLDLIKARVYNSIYESKSTITIPEVSRHVFPFYDRWEVNN